MMPRWLRILIPILLIFITTVTVVHRLGIEEYGRNIRLLSVHSASVIRLNRVENYIESGELSILSARDIMDFYRAQIPINPHVFAQLRSLNIEKNKTYLIASSRRVFATLQESLQGTEIYRDQFNRRFDGNFYPDAFILVSRHEKEEILKSPLNKLEPLPPHQKTFVYLENRSEVDLFFSGPPPSENINLIVPADYDRPELPDEFQEKIDNFFMLGRTANFVNSDARILPGQLNITEIEVSDFQAAGPVKPASPFFYKFLLLFMGVVVGYVGFYHDPRILVWPAWFIVYLLFLIAASTHIAPAGLLAAALLRITYCRRVRGLIWATLCGLVVYGFNFNPYLLNTTANPWVFWSGVALAGFILIPFSARWKKMIITGEDVLFTAVLATIAGIVYSILALETTFFLMPAEYWLLIFAPLLAAFFSRRRDYRRYLFLFVVAVWLLLIGLESGIIVLIGFIIAMIVNVLYIFYLA